jgi:hemolysin III
MQGLPFREPISAWTHFTWMVLAFPAAWPLWRRAGSDPLKRVGAAVFAAGLVACYAGSWLYHSVPAGAVAPFHLLDHVGIYLLIAGTVTPIGLVVLDGWWRRALVGGIWALAFAGIALRLAVTLPIPVLTGFYLFMGWVGCATYCELARRLSRAGLRPLWVGGVCYSVGAVINGVGWPALAPGVFGAHELFHLWVMAGSACHYWFILAAVLPYRAGEAAPAPACCAAAAVPAACAAEPVLAPGGSSA